LNTIKTKKIFYGWFIVFACMLITGGGIGVINSTSGVLVKPVCDELGFSRAEFSFYRTIVTLVGTLLMPFYGKLIGKIGVKKVMLFCTIALSMITFCYSFAMQIWHFYLLATINGVFLNGLHFMTVGILIKNWFDDKQGMATGIAYAGSGIGAAIMAPIVGQIVETMGWQSVFQIIGIIIMAVLLPTVLFFVKERPESIGLAPYKENKKAEEKSKGITFEGLTLKQALKTPTFWLLMVPIFLLAIMASAPNVHTVPYLTDIGYSTAFAASIVSAIMIMLTVAKIILGIFFDKFGTLAGSLFLSVCCIVFPLLALAAENPSIPWIYSVFFGMASSGATVPIAVLVSRYFGSRDYSTIFSVFSMISTLGASVGAPIMGAIYDQTGSYHPAWIMLIIVSMIITVTLIGANIASRKNNRGDLLKNEAHT